MLLDTSMLVDIDCGKHLERTEELPDEWHAISSATYMEVAVEKYKHAIADETLERLTNNVEVLPINHAVLTEQLRSSLI